MMHSPEHRSRLCSCDCPRCTVREPHAWDDHHWLLEALRNERDPLTPALTRELAPISESEYRALWGDR